ncbi:transposase [Corallococcus coralloides]|uniref:transposase n=1 Tax=Corallococcus coralloides TaxID=184914 RepID=UPI000A00D761
MRAAHGGAPWRDVPREQFGSRKTLSRRFCRWQEAVIWARVLRQLHAEAHAAEHLDWTLHFIDASVIRHHQHAIGARGTPVRGGGRSAEPQPGRLFHQAARPGRGPGQAARFRADGGPAP